MGDKQRRDYGTGSISQRADGTWTARMIIGVNEKGKPRVKALYGKSEREVKKKLKEFQKEFYKNDQTIVQKNTVESYMLNWLHTNKRNTLKPKSYDRLEQTLTYQVIPYIGHLQLAAIQANDVQKMINGLADSGKSYSTIKKAYDAVNECFRTGIIQKTVLFNPALGVTVPAKNTFKQKDIRCYDEIETQTLCEVATNIYSNGKRIYRLGDAIVLDVNTGLRLAELLALKWTDVDLENRTIHIGSTRVIVKDRSANAEKKYMVLEQNSTKTKTSTREIPLNDDSYNALLRLSEITGEFEYVLSTKAGKPMTPRYLDRMFRKIAVAAGFDENKIYGLHSLRHPYVKHTTKKYFLQKQKSQTTNKW